DRDADEWNTGAVGPTKRHYADKLMRRLHAAFAPHGVLHYGQGKWYPGEQLPRWAFGLYWRVDGLPLWQDPALIAPEAPGAATVKDAERLAEALVEVLELPEGTAEPAYEDPAFYIFQEGRLPVNLDPAENNLEDPLERRQMIQAFERGLGKPTCVVLPCQLAQSQATARRGPRRRYRWATEKWRTRRGRMFLAPGDAPGGYRLPLTSLPFVPEGEYPFLHQLDPFASRGALPLTEIRRHARFGDGVAEGPDAGPEGLRLRPPLPDPPAGLVPSPSGTVGAPAGFDPMRAIITETVRTAITVEPKNGILSVFLPPVPSADAYVDLVAAVEEAAATIGQPVHIDGYAPPNDYRLNVIKATPDPGVIEVNIQPAHNWGHQTEITETLYEAARHCGLETVKFLHDGRMVGSGGGNHIVVGGMTPADSPFLRRPDLLASLVRYWQAHPSLSYLFSGIFIGPTSQAPRLDEARQDVLYELEIALAEAEKSGPNPPPWLVDRIFRDLLTDLTGNTHRAEICIDKLYSPDGPTGRLGLVEFRAFEM
ncbi:MAG: transglutaminase family protein, partial [Pseudomonadota bacterium]